MMPTIAKPTRPRIVVSTVQLRRPSATRSPSYRVTTQKPESFTREGPRAPNATAPGSA
ncbi:hypothetical protein ABIB15_001598 [Marisediminicola sp. UYEF4]|uniref:hypothetical protein n=1 Tax=Marisediminicola sp. UYEF4 TaxID=1756384 RepID=UPI003391C52F